MAGVSLYDYQTQAVKRMRNGCILCGGVGSGKSRTALAYYYIKQGGEINTDDYVPMDDIAIKDLYIITTARKRDTHEWEGEFLPFLISSDPKNSIYHHKVVVDSWNNIQKYAAVTNAFFIFDEQRVVGSGAWVKSFLKITKSNEWILLSATPGDTWIDYIPVFVANGFYKNRTEFKREHVVYDSYSKFPKVDRYLNTGRLIRLRNLILVNMEFDRKTNAIHENVYVNYDLEKYKKATKTRWDPYKDEPITNATNMCYVWRRIVNEDEARQVTVLEILEKHPRAIIFYNHDYELEILKNLGYAEGTAVSEWNGHKHQPIPECEKWVYLVQYNAGAEGWNCITTDTIIFYSQTYSYKTMIQSAGRIDRLNTPYRNLYYYHIKSHAPIDIAIAKALKDKKRFNERSFVSHFEGGIANV